MRVIRLMRHPAGGLVVTSSRVLPRRLGLTGLLGLLLVLYACIAVWWLTIPTVLIAGLVVLGLRGQRRRG